MSLAKKLQASDDSFGLLTRLFVALKRSGRVVDVVWFQENPEYARAVLALADGLNDMEAREAAIRLRHDLRDFLMYPRSARQAAPAEDVPVVVDRVADAGDAPAAEGQKSDYTTRYTGALR